MENIHPWCISRQLWWGHRIPAWYCDADGSIHVSRTDLSACPKCGGALRQDPDVLDTWFSSGLWPFSTLGWPDETLELRKYYPTSVLVTGFDIIFFWVARMAMLGLHFMKDEPFRDVYIHALVRDAEGQKMSKSKGNVVDPLAIMTKYGTDAFRFTLAALAAQGRDIRISDERVEGYRNFANKLWNASRLVLSNLDGYDPDAATARPPALPGRWIQSRLQATITAVREALDGYRYNDAAGALYQFLWNDFCDWYLEIAKTALYRAGEPAERQRVQHTLVTVLETTLRLLHPFMPFITEDIWQRLPHVGESVMVAPYPRATAALVSPDAERAMSLLMQTVTAVRNIRGEMRISPAQTLTVTVKAGASDEPLLREYTPLLETLARARVTLDPNATRPRASALGVAGQSEIYVELAGLVDLAAERQRLDKEIKRTRRGDRVHERQAGAPRFHRASPGRGRREGARQARRAPGAARQARREPELDRMTAPVAAPALVRLGRVESTQAVAFTLAADGAPDRTVVVAEAQTAGRGRRGRTWHDEPGASLLASIILRPRLLPARLPMLSLAAGIAVAETLERVTGVTPRLKWPNDVLVGGRKLAGILLESRLGAHAARRPRRRRQSHAASVSAGAGRARHLGPPGHRTRRSSRDALLGPLLEALDVWRARLETEGGAPIRERWRALADTLGRRVSIDGVSGIAVDVDEDGALIVLDGDARRRVVAGEVE